MLDSIFKQGNVFRLSSHFKLATSIAFAFVFFLDVKNVYFGFMNLQCVNYAVNMMNTFFIYRLLYWFLTYWRV